MSFSWAVRRARGGRAVCRVVQLLSALCVLSCAADMDDDDEIINPDDLPRRILTDFAIYKDDGAACMRL